MLNFAEFKKNLIENLPYFTHKNDLVDFKFKSLKIEDDRILKSKNGILFSVGCIISNLYVDAKKGPSTKKHFNCLHPFPNNKTMYSYYTYNINQIYNYMNSIFFIDLKPVYFDNINCFINHNGKATNIYYSIDERIYKE